MIPPDANAAFVATMEDVLEVYQRPHDPQRPLVCLDETSKQLIIETRAPIPAKPGQPARHDYEYERNGVANLFMVFAPLEGWRHVKVTDRHTAIDYAHVLRDLSDTHFPDAAKIVLLQDNLNTHKPASLYEAFPAPEARRLVERFEWHYTPKHGSWLDLAESELGVLASQCLDRRIADKQILAREVAAWQDHRNKRHAFDYDLFRGGLGGSSPNDWFLRSTFIVGPIPPEPPILPPILPPEPPPQPLPPGVYPIIGPEIATYGVVQPIARQLGMTTLGTLHDRVGDTSLYANMGAPCPADGNTGDGIWRKAPVKAPTDCLNAGWGPSVWGRVLGQQIDNHYGAFADPRASGQLLGFQSGIDIWRGEWLPGHRDAAGIYVGYANANVDVSGLVTNEAATGYVLRHTGGLNLDAWSGARLLDALRPGRLVPRRGGAGDAVSRLGVHSIRQA